MSIQPNIAAALRNVQALPYGRLDAAPRSNEPGNRVELRPSRLDTLIATRGYRLAWSRAAECPCQPTDRQIASPNPNCPLCSGEGLYYFSPPHKQDLSAEGLTAVQRRLMDRSGGFMIRGMMNYISTSDTMLERMGEWRGGQSTVSVVAGNALAYRDRLISLDQQLPFREVVTVPADPRAPLPLRYLVTGGVHLVRSVERELREGRDWRVKVGIMQLQGAAVPKPGTRLSVAYQTCPTWVVLDMPHAERVINKRFADDLMTQAQKMQPEHPEGRIIRMPLQARVQLQFIPHEATGGAIQ